MISIPNRLIVINDDTQYSKTNHLPITKHKRETDFRVHSYDSLYIHEHSGIVFYYRE